MTILVMHRVQRWFPSARTCSSPQPTERPAGNQCSSGRLEPCFESPGTRSGNSMSFLNTFVRMEPINGSVDACTHNWPTSA